MFSRKARSSRAPAAFKPRMLAIPPLGDSHMTIVNHARYVREGHAVAVEKALAGSILRAAHLVALGAVSQRELVASHACHKAVMQPC
jgi:hypothetical protein